MAIPTTTLAWEREIDDGQVTQEPHPERSLWSAHLCQLIANSYDSFAGAQDIKIVIPDFTKLTRDQRITKMAELFVRVAEYEASWDPNCTSLDVNRRDEPDYLATGLYQLNVGDQDSFQTGTNYTADQLKDPLNNITCGINIALYLIREYGKITFIQGRDEGFFFETLLFDATYLTIDKILKDVWSLPV